MWNLRSKTPETALTTVPWHQDIAYLCPGAEATPQPTAWIPLLDVNEENGTIKLIRGGHRRSGPGSDPTIMKHFLENRRCGEQTSTRRPMIDLVICYDCIHLGLQEWPVLMQVRTATQSSTLLGRKTSLQVIRRAGAHRLRDGRDNQCHPYWLLKSIHPPCWVVLVRNGWFIWLFVGLPDQVRLRER